ncbi:MAG TPA: helix-turn-helix domain-containing protein [Patescibacteria group bacterium]|nr:helix-turn-helix domain-containing protein [Patescibacteria group bacterium]
MSTEVRQQELKHALEELDLSSKEVDVLLALLQAGRASASDLSNRLPTVSRTSIYDQLRSLEQKGLLSTTVEKKTTLYQPEHLGHMIDKLEQDKQVLEQKQNSLRSVTDTYEQMRSGTAYYPCVRTFKGKQGIRAVHRELQNARKELCAIGDLSAVIRAFPNVRTEDNLKDFQTHNIPRKSLMVHNTAGEQYLKVAPPSDSNHVRWLPKDTTVNTDTLMWDGHIAIIDYTEPANTIVIDNPTVYDTFVDWFEMLWNTGKDVIQRSQ